jgi:hypothetical protein
MLAQPGRYAANTLRAVLVACLYYANRVRIRRQLHPAPLVGGSFNGDLAVWRNSSSEGC